MALGIFCKPTKEEILSSVICCDNIGFNLLVQSKYIKKIFLHFNYSAPSNRNEIVNFLINFIYQRKIKFLANIQF